MDRQNELKILLADGCLQGCLVWAILWLIIGALFSVGCCHSKTVTVPQVVTVEVPVTGEALVICHEPTYEPCNQAEAAERVKCLGRNHVALVDCHEQNVATMEGHNAGLVVDDPDQ